MKYKGTAVTLPHSQEFRHRSPDRIPLKETFWPVCMGWGGRGGGCAPYWRV